MAGLDGRSLLLEAPVLQRERHFIQEMPSGRDLFEAILPSGARLVILGTRLPDATLPDMVHRIRSSPATRHVSILALVPAGEPPDLDGRSVEAGANAVLRRPLDRAHLEAWIAKLLLVPRRVEARVPVQGQVVGTPTLPGRGHFYGLTHNLSVNGMLLASPVGLAETPELELRFSLPGSPRLHALGRIVREAREVAWPYLGYGVEFLFVPPDSLQAIGILTAAASALPPALLVNEGAHVIQVTVRRDSWIYEILAPVRQEDGWQVEVRRAPRDSWRPGTGGPFYVVEGPTPESALQMARDFVIRHG